LGSLKTEGVALDVFEAEPVLSEHPFSVDKRMFINTTHTVEVFFSTAVRVFIENTRSN
jgi:phosphoglycerate dehydrogenase-like enzyme